MKILQALQRRWTLVAGGLALGLMCVRIGGLFAQPSPTIPRDADVKKAERVLTPPSGQQDQQDPLLANEKVAANAVVEPRGRELRLAAATAGRVWRVLVEEGAAIEPGQRLVELDDSVERATVDVAKSEVERARAALDRVVRGSRSEDIRASQAEAEQARARAALSEGVRARTERLASAGAVSRDELDRAQRSAEADAAAARVADARLEAALSGSRREDVAEARSLLASALARLSQAEAELALRHVDAPIGGRVLQVKVRPGEYYAPGTEPLLVVGDTSELDVRIDLDERDLLRIGVDSRVEIRIPSQPGVHYGARILTIGQRMGRKNVRTDDPTERNDTKILEVVARVDPGAPLVVGQRVIAMIEPRGKAG